MKVFEIQSFDGLTMKVILFTGSLGRGLIGDSTLGTGHSFLFEQAHLKVRQHLNDKE